MRSGLLAIQNLYLLLDVLGHNNNGGEIELAIKLPIAVLPLATGCPPLGELGLAPCGAPAHGCPPIG
eukprot:3666758-Prorocentrum_lima.AAC.1